MAGVALRGESPLQQKGGRCVRRLGLGGLVSVGHIGCQALRLGRRFDFGASRGVALREVLCTAYVGR